MDGDRPAPQVAWLGRQPYIPVWERMQAFTDERGPGTPDEIWLLEHDPVYTQGRAGKSEHLLAPGNIPVIRSDRGGQVTYHGPGQLMVYTLLDLSRLRLDIRGLVSALEQSVVGCLKDYGIEATCRRDAPGVYVGTAKIASLGLRVRKARSYHGLAMNVHMDLAPFACINPCGFRGMEMTQLSQLGGPTDVQQAARDLLPHLLDRLGLPETTTAT